jgi:endonuclease III
LKPSATTASKPLELLKAHYPNAHCELNFATPFQLLVATILSAQCTDIRVNQVTEVLFSRFPDAESLANADLSEVEEIVKPTGFFKNKAKNIKTSAQVIIQKHKGQVPRTLDELINLPGVGRKTANVVLGNAFSITSGIVVDTHVLRLSYRLGWSRGKTPEQTEQDLQKIIPHEDWILISHLLIWHGRRVCKARNPDCENCFLFDHCPRLGV